MGNSLKIEEFFLNYKKNTLFIITDKNIYEIYENYLKERFKEFKFHLIVIEPGEQSKTFTVYEKTINELMKKEMKKTDLIIAFGGGVVGDLAGFIAGTIFRGVRFVNIPTTLLSMCDSSIGGKTGIDLTYGKNLLGVYKQPEFVLIDTRYLETLKREEYESAMAEVIKVGLIRSKELIDYLLEEKIDNLKMIQMAVKIKKEIVEEDPYEENKRMLLNFGHTFGHAIESYHNYEIKHGYSVAKGMDLAIKYGIKINKTNKEVEVVLNKLYKKFKLEKFTGDSNKYLSKIKYDKKNKDDDLNFVVIAELGRAKIIKIKEEDLNDLSS